MSDTRKTLCNANRSDIVQMVDPSGNISDVPTKGDPPLSPRDVADGRRPVSVAKRLAKGWTEDLAAITLRMAQLAEAAAKFEAPVAWQWPPLPAPPAVEPRPVPVGGPDQAPDPAPAA